MSSHEKEHVVTKEKGVSGGAEDHVIDSTKETKSAGSCDEKTLHNDASRHGTRKNSLKQPLEIPAATEIEGIDMADDAEAVREELAPNVEIDFPDGGLRAWSIVFGVSELD
jgi:hypothetical protein